MYKECNVVMLATNEKANKYDSYNKNEIYELHCIIGSKLKITDEELDVDDI